MVKVRIDIRLKHLKPSCEMCVTADRSTSGYNYLRKWSVVVIICSKFDTYLEFLLFKT